MPFVSWMMIQDLICISCLPTAQEHLQLFKRRHESNDAAPVLLFLHREAFFCASLRSGSGPAELIIVQLGWMLAGVQIPPPPPGPPAPQMKHEDELDRGRGVGALTCTLDIERCGAAVRLNHVVNVDAGDEHPFITHLILTADFHGAWIANRVGSRAADGVSVCGHNGAITRIHFNRQVKFTCRQLRLQEKVQWIVAFFFLFVFAVLRRAVRS